jgi:hypothetical protein
MNALLEFSSVNASVLLALIALLISLRANYTAHQAHKLNLRSKADAERLLFYEKKREPLNELDRQHSRFSTLMLLTAQKLLLFREHPHLHDTMQDEVARLKSNLRAVQDLVDKHEEQRKGIEAIGVGADVAAQEELLANVRRLTIHVEKDIAHEHALLGELREQLDRSGA